MTRQQRPIWVVAMIIAVAAAAMACGEAQRDASSQGAPSSVGVDPAAGATGPAASSAAGPAGVDVAAKLEAALSEVNPLGLARTERSLSDAVDEEAGLAAVLGADLQGWLQDQRSAAAVAALEANGIDPASVVPTALSTEPIASTDLGLTAATGLGWIGTGFVATTIVQGAAGSFGQGSGPSSAAPAQVTAETTIGDRHLAVTITVTTQIQISGSRVIADAETVENLTETSVRTGAQVGTSTSRNKIHIEADLCPDANGGIAVEVSSDWTEDAGGMPGGGSFALQSTITVQATVNASAFLVSSTNTVASTFQGTSAGTTQSGSATSSWSQSMGARGAIRGGSISGATGTTTGSYPPQQAAALQGISSIMPLIVAGQVLETAQEAWRGGKCVEITATERSRTVRVREVVPFTAQPRHKLEGVDLDQPVVASFSGERSVAPVDVAVDAPAAFTYTAPASDRRAGLIKLTTTSNRGIGMLDLAFTPEYQGWQIDVQFTNAVGAKGTHLGIKCGNDPGGRWKLAGTYEFMGFKGKQLWTIDLDVSQTVVNNQFVYLGTYTYRDDSTGPFGVKQHTRVSGTVEATVDEVDGSVRMVMTETSREQTAEAPGGGTGAGPNTPQPTMTDLVWTADAGC